MPTILELKQKRAGLVSDARKIVDAADKRPAETRSLTTEENATWDRYMEDVEKLGKEVEVAEKEETRRRTLADLERTMGESAGRKTNPETPGAGAGGEEHRDYLDIEVRSAPGAKEMYQTIKYHPEHAGTLPVNFSKPALDKAYRLSRPERRSAFSKWLGGGQPACTNDEFRDLQADSDISGGFLNSPMQMIQMLLKFVDNAVFVRQRATVYTFPTAQSVGVPSLDVDADDATWTAEIATGVPETGMTFGKRELHPHPLAKRIKISNKLLRTAMLGPEAIIRDRFGYKFGVAQEKGFMTGSGSNQPLGLFTASANGIDTSRDVNTNNTTTAIVADNLHEVKGSLKTQYQVDAEWIFNRTVITQLRKLKDGIGQYMWQPGLVGGQPDRLLGSAVNSSEYAPNTMTSGLYVGLYGSMRFYWIADALNLEIQRLTELYAEANQTGFIGRLETDGMPVLAEAFARVKLA